MKERIKKKESWIKRKYYKFKDEFKKEFLSDKPINVIKNILLIIAGNLFLAISASFFLVPCNLVTGGVSGIAIIIMKIISLAHGESIVADSYGIVDTNFIITILTIFFFILGLLIVGFNFSLKTLISTIVYPLFIYLFDFLRELGGTNNFLNIKNYLPSVTSGTNPFSSYMTYDYLNTPSVIGILILAALFGGLLMGFGVALSFKGGGSTGGTDCIIIALDRHTKMKSSNISAVMDSLIIIIGILITKDLIMGLIGIMGAVCCALMIGKVYVGASTELYARIVSNKWNEISDSINKEMERGTTIYAATGGYTGDEKRVVTTSFSKDQYNDFMKIMKRIDPRAFVTISTMYEVQGYGFSYGDDNIPKIKEEVNHNQK